jgi:hypothetical protein
MAIWYMLWPSGIFYGRLVHFMAIWYILYPFGIFYGHLVRFSQFWYVLPTNKNLATLARVTGKILWNRAPAAAYIYKRPECE